MISDTQNNSVHMDQELGMARHRANVPKRQNNRHEVGRLTDRNFIKDSIRFMQPLERWNFKGDSKERETTCTCHEKTWQKDML